MADGWAVVVSTPALDGGNPTDEMFYAHIPGRADAEAAVRTLARVNGELVEARSIVAHNAFVEMGIAEGEVRRWP